MTTRHLRRTRTAATMLALVLGPAACVEQVRVPLAVPLPAVGGARPGAPTGLQLVADFGDGVWGQEQERAEMVGAGLGISAADVFEVISAAATSTRTVRSPGGSEHTGESTTGVRAKVRMVDFLGGRAAVGVHLAWNGASRERGDVQDDHLSAVDVAVPVEFYLTSGLVAPHRLGGYVAPRVVFQTFEDRRGRRKTTQRGAMAGFLAGLTARWTYLSLTGELNLMRAAEMEFEGRTFSGGWMVLPQVGVRALLPLGS